MGGSSSKGQPTQDEIDKQAQAQDQAIASDQVELELIEQQIQDLYKFKILLLGAGESGKSTVVKQLKLIHTKKTTSKELKLIALSLHQNVIDCMRALILAARSMFQGNLNLDEEDRRTEEEIMRHDENEKIPPHLAEGILRLFKSEAITSAYDRRSEFWLLDSFPYYIKNVTRFCEESFVPNEEDVVMARIRTTGIVVTELEQKISGTESKEEPDMIKFQVVDVGGQRNERKKWMHCFDDVKAILFIVNLAGYNQVLFEDASKNRMIEELELFHTITHNPLFTNTPIFLFLNKKDLFETMVKDVDMKRTFPDYEGGKNLKPALDYITEQFKKQLPPNKDVNVQIVSARWKRDVRSAFEEVKITLYENNKRELYQQAQMIRNRQKKVTKSVANAQAGQSNQEKCCSGCCTGCEGCCS